MAVAVYTHYGRPNPGLHCPYVTDSSRLAYTKIHTILTSVALTHTDGRGGISIWRNYQELSAGGIICSNSEAILYDRPPPVTTRFVPLG
jgi:hypothetical protein